jgi:hypothetical protein
MPVFIDEVIAEVEPTAAPESGVETEAQVMPLASSELELAQTLALMEQRRERLTVD